MSAGNPTTLIGGSGVLGLMTAVRLADAGHRVTVIEGRDRLSSGATSQNLGGIQTGIVYVPKFEACVEPFKEGVGHYQHMFPHAQVNEDPKWYVGTPNDIATLRSRLVDHQISFRDVRLDERLEVFRPESVAAFDGVEVPGEFVASSHRVMQDLAQRCRDLGVTFVLGQPIQDVSFTKDKYGLRATGVQTTKGSYGADNVVLACGFGMPDIAAKIDRRFGSALNRHFAVSRGTYYLTRPGALPLRRAIHTVSDTLPSIMPARNGHVYIVNSSTDLDKGDWRSLQPYNEGFVNNEHPVMSYEAADLKCAPNPELDPDGRATTETIPLPGIVGPRQTGIRNLHFGNPGRMTFAPSASHALAFEVCGHKAGDIVMDPFVRPIEYETAKLVNPPVWAYGGQIERTNGSFMDLGDRLRATLLPDQTHVDGRDASLEH